MWTGLAKDAIDWDGTLSAKKFLGDGSSLTNLPAGTETDPIFNVASAAYNAHVADTSDPHGATLTQTYLTLTSGAITADITASGAALIRNFLIGTEASTALTASNYPQGTVYLKYT